MKMYKLGIEPGELLDIINGRKVPTKAIVQGLAKELDSDVLYLRKTRRGSQNGPGGKVRLLALSLVLTTSLGCSRRNPKEWYLTAYENERYVFSHDHKKYTAECFQSFGTGKKVPDLTPDCSILIMIPGIGHQVSVGTGSNSTWLSMETWAIYTPAGDSGPQYQLKFVSIEPEK
jgi:hypothetical protein